MPFVTVTTVGRTQPRDGAAFVICPVDDENHLLFFGAFGDTPSEAPEAQPGFVAPGELPRPSGFRWTLRRTRHRLGPGPCPPRHRSLHGIGAKPP